MDTIYRIINKTVDILRVLKNNWLIVCIIAGVIAVILIALFIFMKLIKKNKAKKVEKTDNDKNKISAADSDDVNILDTDNIDLGIGDDLHLSTSDDLDLSDTAEINFFESENTTENITEQIGQEAVEAISEETTEQIPEEIPKKTTEKISEKAVEDITEEIREEIPEDIAEKISKEITEETPEDIIEEISEEINIDKPKAAEKQLQVNYDSIIKLIKRNAKKHKSIIFTSMDIDSLPVTLPTNVAIKLAKSNKRCLLIDLDLKRDAIAKAFELDADKYGVHLKALKTSCENLWVLPGHSFVRSKQMNIKGIVQKAVEKFDFVLINAPALVTSPDRKLIISTAKAAFICSNKSSQTTPLDKMIKASGCKVLDIIQIPC